MKFFISICYFHLLIRFYVYTRKIQFLCIIHTSLMYSRPLYLMLMITCHNSSKQDPLTQKNPTPTKKDHQKAAPQNSILSPTPCSTAFSYKYFVTIISTTAKPTDLKTVISSSFSLPAFSPLII